MSSCRNQTCRAFLKMWRPMFHFDHCFYTVFTSHNLRSVFRVLVRSNFGIFWVTTMGFFFFDAAISKPFSGTLENVERESVKTNIYTRRLVFIYRLIRQWENFRAFDRSFRGQVIIVGHSTTPEQTFRTIRMVFVRAPSWLNAFFRIISRVCRLVEFNRTHGGVPVHTTRQGV